MAEGAPRLADLDEADRAFTELMAGVYVRLSAIGVAFPDGRRGLAIRAAQTAIVRLSVAAVSPATDRD